MSLATAQPVSSNRRLERIIEISRILTSTLELEPLLQTIVETAAELTESEASSIMLLDPSSGELRFEAAPWFQRDQLKAVAVPLDRSIAGWIFRHARPIVIPDARTDPRVYRAVDQMIEFDTRSLLGVPLMIKDRPIGVLEAVNKLGDRAFTEADVDTLTTLAAQAAIAIENARLLAALQQAYDDLAELDKMKSDFIAIASHELRTPLGLILGHASFLRETLGEEAAAELDVVVRSALRLKGIIEDLSNLTHFEQGEVKLRRSTFGIEEVVRDVIEEVQGLAQAKQLDLHAQLPAGPVTVSADREKIRTALTNLVNNAVKFTPEGGRILVTAQPLPGQVCVSVLDTGIGVPADQVERIFERFHQVQSHLTRRQGGMGIGLSIAKAMIDLHGGRIWCESVEGRGSNFTFALPRTGTTAAFTTSPLVA